MRRCRKWSEKPLRTQPNRALFALTLTMAGVACSGEPEPEPIPLEDRTPKVLVIGVDGVRVDVLNEVATPNLDALAAGGTFTARTRTTTPSVSGPAWSSMLTGVWPEKHGVTNNDFDGRSYDAYPDFLTLIEQVRPELSTFAVVDWAPLGTLEGGGTAIGEALDVRVVLDGYELGWAEADTRSTALAVEHISEADPDAMFVYLGNPDETSHENRSIGAEYREAIALSDRHIGMMVSAIRARPRFEAENWLILVSTDHGRTADGGHGGDTPVEMTTFIVVSGRGAVIGAAPEATFIVDIPVTALAHLGIPIMPEWELDGRAVGLR